jgi:hypothetical protein
VAGDNSETESGGKSSDIRVGLREVGVDKTKYGWAWRHTTYLFVILGELKIGLDGFGHQRREVNQDRPSIQSPSKHVRSS